MSGVVVMDHINCEAIARSRVGDPMNTWPEHMTGHRITLLGNRLFDYDCLRCWLERVATEKAARVTHVVGREVSGEPTTAVGRVQKGRKSVGGCCERYADNMACDCMEEAMLLDSEFDGE